MRLVKRGPWVAARLNHSEEIGWQAEINGVAGEAHPDPVKAENVFRVWTSGRLIDEAEYNYLLGLKQWAERNAPNHPAAQADMPVNLNFAPPLF
jgi:hypothetical protein